MKSKEFRGFNKRFNFYIRKWKERNFLKNYIRKFFGIEICREQFRLEQGDRRKIKVKEEEIDN